MKQGLITVIEKTIDVLENNRVEYMWLNQAACNCGILAQQALSISHNQLKDIIYGIHNDKCRVTYGETPWAIKAKNESLCQQSGFEISFIFNKLFQIGLSADDIKHLENLSDERILKGCKDMVMSFGNYVKRGDKSNVIKYLKSWRELLIEESQPKVEYKLVYSDHKVKALVNEKLILS